MRPRRAPLLPCSGFAVASSFLGAPKHAWSMHILQGTGTLASEGPLRGPCQSQHGIAGAVTAS